MRALKIIVIVLVAVFVLIQFIRPSRNISSGAQTASIEQQIAVPDDVQELLKSACYDCHSNNTRYPWYVNIQPVAWFMADHVKHGKSELNFDEFGSYSKRRQGSKLSSIASSLKDGSMPIDSYTWMHKEARLTERNRNSIIEWALQNKSILESRP